MPKKVTIARTDDFEAVETELASALEMLDDANARIELLLSEHKTTEPDAALQDGENETVPEENA